MPSNLTALSDHDLAILRTLADWQGQAVETAANKEKIAAWKRHDAGLPGSRVMVIAETFYTTDATRLQNDDLQCVDDWARGLEYGMRLKKMEVETLRDDHFVQPWVEFAPHMWGSDYGVPSGVHRESGANALSYQFRAPLVALDDADFARLHPREFFMNGEAEERERARLEAIFAGILPVRRRLSGWQQSMPLTSMALNFLGLDNFLLLLYDNPDGVHRLMRFLRDDYLTFIRFTEHHLLELNNEGDYVGSGCMGCSDLLPAADFTGEVRSKDLWYFCESQESVSISPAQYGEFVFPYLSEIAVKFGRVYYGCCEGVHPIWPYISTLPNLQRVSISPWADEALMGKHCRERGVVYSRKPSPNLFMGEQFDEAAMRAHLQYTVDCTPHCRLEFILRDVYTTNNDPQRFIGFVELAREEGAKHIV